MSANRSLLGLSSLSVTRRELGSSLVLLGARALQSPWDFLLFFFGAFRDIFGVRYCFRWSTIEGEVFFCSVSKIIVVIVFARGIKTS